MTNFEDIKNKFAVVSGASRGIGKAVTEILLEKGAYVYGMARDLVEMEQNTKKKYNDRFIPLQADLSNPEIIEKMSQEIKSVDILVHNAACFEPSPLNQLSPESWNQQISLNLTAPFLLTRSLWEKLKKPPGEDSSIIFISSLAGVQGKEKFPGTSAYVASKMGLVGFCEVVAAEGKPFGIRANAISPGSVDTLMLRNAFPDMPADFQPRDIAHVVLYYASQISGGITGTNVMVQK